MSEKTLYSVLGVTATASPVEIRDAYRRLAKQWHPDRHRGSKQAEEIMTSLNAAYDVLSDPCKRASYDKRGQPMGNMMDMFAEMFGEFFKEPASDRWSDPLQEPTYCKACGNRRYITQQRGMYIFKIPCSKCSVKKR